MILCWATFPLKKNKSYINGRDAQGAQKEKLQLKNSINLQPSPPLHPHAVESSFSNEARSSMPSQPAVSERATCEVVLSIPIRYAHLNEKNCESFSPTTQQEDELQSSCAQF